MKIPLFRLARCSTLPVFLLWAWAAITRASDPATSSVNGQIPSAPTSELRSWFMRAEPMKIAGPIHFVGTRGLGIYLITTAEGHILLFGGMPKTGPAVEASIRKLGFDPKDIKILLTCHAHLDHVGTHAYFKSISGAQVALMQEEVDLLESGGTTDFHYGRLPLFHFPPVKVDRVLRDGDKVTLGGVTMTAHHTPGHTKGGTTWTMNIEEEGQNYRVIFPDGTGVNPGYRLVHQPSYPGILDDLRGSLRAHAAFKPDIWLSSHTSMFDFDAKSARAAKEGYRAWIDPEGYARYVAGRRETLDKLIAAERASPDITAAPWQLAKAINGDGQTINGNDNAGFSVTFHPDGEADVHFDVEHATGTWKLAGWNEMVLGPLQFTPSSEPRNPVIERIAADWPSIRRYDFDGQRLILTLAAAAGRYEFERTSEAMQPAQ